ncbi:MAG: N-acetylglucosamine-6-phosphate deacetylase [Proteobacteria bacterium]|nr:N-acetylglucosamine-6-phosphate deacetylase [Pseudomonadota bacterium]
MPDFKTPVLGFDQNFPNHALIDAATLFDGESFRHNTRLEIRDDRIVALHARGGDAGGLPLLTLPEGCILAPGFIDTQVNGGGDVLLNDAPSLESVQRIARAHRRFGTTGLLPTLITDSPEKLAALASCAEQSLALPGVLGFHLEGPFLNIARKGIHPVSWIRQPNPENIEALKRFGAIGRSLVTLAPETMPSTVLDTLAQSGLRLAIGHSEANAEEALSAIEHGVTGVTHLYNAMSQLSARAPGIVGAAFADPRLIAGIICDGLHVAPLALRAAFKAMGPERVMLVTDAMSTAGGRAGGFELDGKTILLRDGKLTDAQGTLAGAHLTMIDAVQNAVEMMGASLADALIMASRTPARFLGLDASLGRIAPGFQADLVAFDGRDILTTWIAGERLGILG